MSSLVLMAGISGSGKSTFAKSICTENDIYISRDEIRFSMLKDEDDYFSKENEVMKEFIKEINAGIAANKRLVIADATHLTPKSRRKILENITDKPDNIYVIYMDVSLEVALERNSKRKGRACVPESQIRNMNDSFVFPTADEGIDTVFSVDKNGIIIIDRIVNYTKKGDR
jgi:predicted kinase